MYIKEIKDMINLMNENGLSELEIEKEGVRIRLKKGAGDSYEKTVLVSANEAAKEALPQGPKGREDAAAGKSALEIKAPMVGTFYRAPSPEAPPYVNIGDKIEAGQVICVIEAMKLMNDIKSDVRGKVVDIQVENAEPVEFGQVLFIVEPA